MSVNLIRTLSRLNTRPILRRIAITTVAIMSVLWSAHSHARFPARLLPGTYILFDPGNRFARDQRVEFVQGRNPVEIRYDEVFSWTDNQEIYTEVWAAASIYGHSIWIDGAAYTVFKLNSIPNIGYVIAVKDPGSGIWKPLYDHSTYDGLQEPGTRVTFRAPRGGTCCKVGLDIKVTFIKLDRQPVISDLPLDALHNLTLVRMRLMHKNGGIFRPADTATIGVRLNTRNATCTQTKATTQNILLPNVPLSAFPTVGSTYEGNQEARFSLQCGAGVTVYATLTDAKNPSNTGDTLTTTGSAKGVGVQLLQTSHIYTNTNCGRGRPCKFGPDSPDKGNTNQWLAGGFRGTATYPTNPLISFRARYIRTGSLQPGDVQAQSTITFSYQ